MTKQVVGATVSPDGGEGLLGAEIEDLLEAERPAASLSRRNSIFLATRPGGTDFTYLAEAQGRLERQHSGWLEMLLEADPMQEGVRRHLAICYWKGAECRERNRAPWVYRAESVKLGERIGGSSQGTG